VNKLLIANNLKLPLEAVTQTFAIIAKRGVGKTYTAAVMIEEMLKAGLPVCIVDPIGVWWGLRSAADGKSPGLPIAVLGGEHGDMPLTEDMGEVVASLVAEQQIPVVLDLSLFRKAAQARFMTAFAETLYQHNRKPLHLVLDEADAFAPQRPMKGQERMLGAIEDIVRRGRARGLGVTLITQRAAVLNKDVLTQVEVLVTLRTIAPQDRAAIDEWIKVHGAPEQRVQLMQSLPSLPIGTAWFWSPGWLDIFQQVQVRRRETFDSSSTPKVGEQKAAPKSIADIDVSTLQEHLATSLKKAEQTDPKALQRRIAQLESELKKKATPVVQTVEVPVLPDEHLERLEMVAQRARDQGQQMIEQGQALIAFGQQVMAQLSQLLKPLPVVQRPVSIIRPPIASRPTPPPVSNGGTTGDGAVSLPTGAVRMLQVLTQRYPIKLTRAQLGTLAGFTPSGGTFGNYFSLLRKGGFIQEMAGEVQATQHGMDYLGTDISPAPSSTDELLAMWRKNLVSGEASMLDVLVAEYPNWMTRQTLGELTNFTPSGGTFGNYLSTLRRNELVEVNGQDVRASPTLFIDGERV